MFPVQAKCKKCNHVCAADSIRDFNKEYADAECEKGGKHDFEEIEEAEVSPPWDDFSGQIAL